jgi:RNA polymerase sigma-70 factor (ECF subfamily)
MQLALNPDMIGCVTDQPTRTTRGTNSELCDIDALDRMYRARLLRFVAFATGDLDLAETIVQDSLLKAYRARESFRGDCGIYTWLSRIATNLVRDRQRSRSFQFWRKVHKTAPDLSEISPFLQTTESSPEAQLLAHERAQMVAVCLESLSTNQRTVFLLRFIEEMELPEICQATGMTISTVKTHLHRAVKTIRVKVGGEQK